MLRRALVITSIAVALSAAAALAFVPGFSRVSRGWSLSGVWSGRGFTPVPPSHDGRGSADDLLLQNEGGVPGTYCPIPPRNSSSAAAAPAQHSSTEMPLSSGASMAPRGKTDLLPAAPAATCILPNAPPAASQSRVILP